MTASNQPHTLIGLNRVLPSRPQQLLLPAWVISLRRGCFVQHISVHILFPPPHHPDTCKASTGTPYQLILGPVTAVGLASGVDSGLLRSTPRLAGWLAGNGSNSKPAGIQRALAGTLLQSPDWLTAFTALPGWQLTSLGWQRLTFCHTLWWQWPRPRRPVCALPRQVACRDDGAILAPRAPDLREG